MNVLFLAHLHSGYKKILVFFTLCFFNKKKKFKTIRDFVLELFYLRNIIS